LIDLDLGDNKLKYALIELGGRV